MKISTKYLLQIIFTALLSLIILSVCRAQNDEIQVEGLWQSLKEEPIPLDWKANWIWLPDTITSDVMLARRSIEFSSVPDSVQLCITATSQYQLYVNGQYVSRGPARCAPHHQSFDVWDISTLIQKGTNVIAIRVHHQRGKYSYHHQVRGGLLCQLTIYSAGQTSTIATDKQWRVLADNSWDNRAPSISRFQLVVNDRVDLNNYERNWWKLDFDHTKWIYANELMRTVGWPSTQKNAAPQPLTPPWLQLNQRDLPYLTESIARPVKIASSKIHHASDSHPAQDFQMPISLVDNPDPKIAASFMAHIESEKPLLLTAPREAKQIIVFDFGELIKGSPVLEITGTKGQVVEIMSAPFSVDHTFDYRVVDSEFRDQIVLSGEKDLWEATYFKPARYVALAYTAQEKPMQVHQIALRKIAYPFKQKGEMHSTDADWIARYFEATRKTILACTTDALTDNYRERRQYAQTGYYGAMGNYWIFGDYALQRRYLIQVAQEQQANGMMPAYAPLAKDDFMIILDSNCLWIRSLKNYFLFSGDKKTVVQLLPAAKKLMSLLHSFTHEFGFIYDPPYAYWLDHAVIDRRGANFCLNGHYLGALEDFAVLLGWLEDNSASEFLQRASILRQSLQQYFWNDEKKLFADAWIGSKAHAQFSEHANGMALALNIASESQAREIAQQLLADDPLNYINRSNGMTMVTPAMSYFLKKGLCEYGYIDESFKLFRKRFDKMLADDSNGTLWEEWWLDKTGRSGKEQPKSRSDAQTESAFPPALFAEYLLGIQPTKPGWQEISIKHYPSAINNMDAKIPTPLGIISANWSERDKKKRLEINTPGAMMIKLNKNHFYNPENRPVLVDGNKWKDHLEELILDGGRHVIEF